MRMKRIKKLMEEREDLIVLVVGAKNDVVIKEAQIIDAIVHDMPDHLIDFITVNWDKVHDEFCI